MSKCKKTKDADLFPGVAIDAADGQKVEKKAEKERTKTLDNNPRDSKP